MPDTQRAHITDLGHANLDETDVIMTKGRDMNSSLAGEPLIFRHSRFGTVMPGGTG